MGPKPKNPNSNQNNSKNKKKQKVEKKEKQKQGQGKGKKKKIVCYVCQKPGHIASNCEKLKKFQAAEAANAAQS